MKHLIETTDLSSLATVQYDRIVLNSSTNDVIVKGGEYEYEVMPSSYIYNETDDKYYQKLVAYGEPIEIENIDLNSQWVSDTTDDGYNYFKSNSYEVEEGLSFSQCKVTWSNLAFVTFKYMSSGSVDMGTLFMSKLDGKKFTSQTSEDDVYLLTIDKTPGTYNEITIECDEGEHYIWFGYMKDVGATDENRGFIGVPKSVRTVLDVKQGAELPMEYKYGGVSAEGGKIYNINFKNVILPNGNNAVTFYEDYTKTEKTINTEYVDLGLPSGLKWAKCNIGATSETDYGAYFQWGDISGVSESLVGKYSDENYSWAKAPFNGGNTDYNADAFNQVKDTVCPNGILAKEYDTASRIMGDDWRMPTIAEFQELINNTTKEWTQVNGVNGYKFTSKKEGYQNNSIFIPAAGLCGNGSVNNVRYLGHIWSSSLDTSYHGYAQSLGFDSDDCRVYVSHRYRGQSVRGVRK